MGIYLKALDFYPAGTGREADHYEARFIDVPNCIALAATAVEAEIQAASMLTAHIRFLETRGRRMPAPSGLRHRGRSPAERVIHVQPPAGMGTAQARPASTASGEVACLA